MSKSDDWPCLGTRLTHSNGQGYIDPCDIDFASQFERHDDGRIKPTTEVGKYMFQQLKLGLRRHELIWLLGQLQEKIKVVYELFQRHKHTAKAKDLLEKHMELANEYFKYKDLYEDGI